MKNLILAFVLSTLTCATVFAQDKPVAKPEAPKQSLLKPEQTQKLKDIEQNLRTIEAQLTSLQAQQTAALMTIEALLRDYFIANRVNPDEFDIKVQPLDQERTVYGFVPKSKEPPKPKK